MAIVKEKSRKELDQFFKTATIFEKDMTRVYREEQFEIASIGSLDGLNYAIMVTYIHPVCCQKQLSA